MLAVERIIEEDRDFEKELMDSDKKVEWQKEEEEIREAKYNRKYKELRKNGESLKYLRREFLERTKFGTGVRAMAKVRCGHMEEDN